MTDILYITTADRKALKGSIKAWEKRAAGEYKDATRENCPLCVLHLSVPHLMQLGGTCAECPVMAWTGVMLCGGTPACFYGYKSYSPKTNIRLAKKEVTFLKDLLKRSRHMK